MARHDDSPARSAGAAGYLDEVVCTSLSVLMLRWQATGAEATFEVIVEQVRPHVERVVERVLRRHGLRDPAAIDDAVALVLDHLRRLAGSEAQERPVAKFAPAATRTSTRTTRDPGRAFVTCLATDRARDVARARRRQRIVPFSQLGADATQSFERRLADSASAGDGPPPIDRAREAAVRLEPRQRLLIELLLDGKSQAMIAHVLDVSEGTVSRLRGRAITALQALLEE
jgi:DNA-directed RNA polymerase specialized sigma24 family protein